MVIEIVLSCLVYYVVIYKNVFDVISFGVINFYVIWELFIIYYFFIIL